MSTVLTRDEILGAKDTLIEWVEVPQWGLDSDGQPKGVFVRGLTGSDRDDFEMNMIETKGKKTELNLRNLRAKLLVRTIVDSDDPAVAQKVFEIEDIEALGRKSGQALQLLYAVAQRLSGLSAEDVEELASELGKGPSDGSGSSSPLLLGTAPSPSANDGSPLESSPSGSPTIGSIPSEVAG